jgi:preprotein translocase subunit SecF
MKFLKLVPDDTKFGFMKFRDISFPISALVSIICIVGFLVFGLNSGIDFKGGTLIEVQSSAPTSNISDLRTQMGKLINGEVQIQEFGSNTIFLVRYSDQVGGEKAQQAALEKVKEALKGKYDIRRNEVVGPRVSGELLQGSTVGVIVAILAVLVYLWLRFEWQFAIGAMIATVHDVVVIVGFYTITQIDFDMSSIAAILTVMGFSLNDTVVVYDRIRETLRKYKKMSISDVLDLSINSTLSRTVVTSVTVFLSVLALYLFGGDVIHGFAAAMLVGVIVGTYSSIFIAAPILIYLGVSGASALSSEKSAKDAAP